ncbi:hypothetical protein Tco_1560410, partial [Tanacetum coccineum]
MEHTFELIDTIPLIPHDSLLTGGYTPRGDKGRMKLEELMTMCTKLSKQVLDLEKKKDAQAVEILKLNKREDASKQGRNSDKTKLMFKVSNFDVLDDVMEDVDFSTSRPEVSVASVPLNVSTATPSTPPTTTTIFDDDEDLTITQTLVKMRSKGVLVEEEPDPSVKIKRSDQGDLQLQADVELAQLLHQEELAEVERRQRERVAQEEASMAALYEEAQFLVETIAAQRNFRAAQRAVEIRSKPPTKTQLRNMMITYLKNKGKVNHNHLKGKSYEELRGLYEREQKWINDFVPMDSEKEEKKSVEPESEGKKGKRIKRVADSALKQKSS